MRSYPKNSPQAAARIVALVLIADGHVSQSEIDALNHLQVEAELGLAPGGFTQVIHTLCEDLMMGVGGGASMMDSVDDDTLAALLREVDAPALRLAVLRLVDAAVMADQCNSESEARVMAALHQHWVLAAVADEAYTRPPMQLQAA